MLQPIIPLWQESEEILSISYRAKIKKKIILSCIFYWKNMFFNRLYYFFNFSSIIDKTVDFWLDYPIWDFIMHQYGHLLLNLSPSYESTHEELLFIWYASVYNTLLCRPAIWDSRPIHWQLVHPASMRNSCLFGMLQSNIIK